jgi:hypothetical protein
MEANKELALITLLSDAFDGDVAGFQRWIRLSFGKQIHHELPSAPSLADLAFHAMLALQRNGLMHRALFEGLRALRPGLHARIREAARLWGIELAEAVPASPPSPASDIVLDRHTHLPHLNRLESLLASLFTPQEAHEWLTRIMGSQAQGDVPSTVLVSASMIREHILALHRRGLLGTEFFRALAAERPGRIADVKLTECWWLGRPKHFRLSPYMCIRGEDYQLEIASIPDSCISVQLSATLAWDPLSFAIMHERAGNGNDIGPDELLFASDGVVFDMDAYPDPAILLEDLYVNYLRTSFPPLTYGTTWIVQGDRAVVPWEWLLGHHTSGHQPLIAWLTSINYADFGITRGSHIEAIDLRQHEPDWQVCGIATNSLELYRLLCSGSKAAWSFIDSDLVADVSPASVVPGNFQHLSVHVRNSMFGWRIARHGAYVQARPVDPREQAHLNHLSERLAQREAQVRSRAP